MVQEMTDPMMILMLVLGTVIHVIGTLAEESKEVGRRVSLGEYSDQHPYQTVMGVGLSVVAYFLMQEAGQLNLAVAFACGYGGDSIIKKFTNATEIGKRKD